MTLGSSTASRPVYGNTDADYFTGNFAGQLPSHPARSQSSSRSASPLYHLGTFNCRGGQQPPSYTLEILRFSPSNGGEMALIDKGNKPRDAGSRVIPVPLWKTLRRNSSGLKNNKLFSAENDADVQDFIPINKYLKKEAECLHTCSNQVCTWADNSSRQRGSSRAFRSTGRESLRRSPLLLPKTLTRAHFIMSGRQQLGDLTAETDFCNSQSSPVAENLALKSPKQKPSKKTRSSSKESHKKTPKHKSISAKEAALLGGVVKHGPTSPPVIPTRSTHKKTSTYYEKHNNSMSMSVKTATNDQLPPNSTNSSDTVAIAVNKLNSEHNALYSPKAKKFSDEAEKLLSITKYKTGVHRENSEENETLGTSSSHKSCHSNADNLDTKPSRSSFTASQLPAEKKSSQETNATQETSPKMMDDLNEESDSSSSDDDSDTNSVSNRNITVPSSPRPMGRGVASPSEALETVSNFVTKNSDVSPSFLSPSISLSQARRHVHQSSSSALHKYRTREMARGSRKYRKIKQEDTESTALTSPHKRAIRSASCPMNPMTTPEYIEATRHTVVGSSSSFLKALKGQRNWYPKVVTWFQTLLGRETPQPPSISLITSHDDIQEPKIDYLSPCIIKTESRLSTQDDSFSSIVLEKLKPTGRWASAKVSNLLKDVLSSQPCELTSETCLICPADDGPCPCGPLEEGTSAQFNGGKKSKKKKDREGKSLRKKISDCDIPAPIMEEHDEHKDRDTITASTSPPKKSGMLSKSSKKGETDLDERCRYSANKKSPFPQCIWEEPEPPPTETEEVLAVSKEQSGSKKILRVDGHDKVCDDTEPGRGDDVEPFCPDNDDAYSIASLDFEGIGGVDQKRVTKEREKKPVELLNLSSMSPSFVSFALSAAGNTIWSQLEKIREANVKYQFPQRRGLYEPPKAYPIWLYAEHIKKLLGFFGQGKSSGDPKDDKCANLKSNTLTKKSSYDDSAYRTADSKPAKEKESNRESASSWASNVTAQPKQEEPEYIPQTVDNFRELRLCYPSLPLPIYRHPIHRYCHCCKQRPRKRCHQSQSFATCAVCPTHGATFRSPSSGASFRRRSCSPRPSTDDDCHCCVYRACPRPNPVIRCCSSRRPRMPRASKKEYVRRGSSFPSNHRITPLSACCARVLKMMHCDAFAHSELKRKSCLLSEKGDRYYYKNLFKKRINMKNFMKEMSKRPSVQINQEVQDDDVENKGDEVPADDKCPEMYEFQKTECANLDSIKLEGESPLADTLAKYRSTYISPNRHSCCSPYGTTSPTKKMSEDKLDQSKNKSDNYETTVEEYQELSKHLLAETLETWRNERMSGDEHKWDLSEHLIKMFSPREATPPKPVIDFSSNRECSEGCDAQKPEKVDVEMYQCPCGLSFVQPSSLQYELAFNRKRELLASKIKDGNIEPAPQVLPYAGPYRYEDLHPPMSQLKTERNKPKNDFRHSSFLYEDVLRDKFIPSKEEGSVIVPKSDFKKSTLYDNHPMTTEEVAKNVLNNLPKVSYKPPIYKHGQEPVSRRYDTNYNKCVRKTQSLKRSENHLSGMGNSFHDGKDTFAIPASNVGSGLNVPFKDFGSSNVYQNRRSQSIGDMDSSHKAHLLSLKHSYISAKTSSLLHGTANYGHLLNMNSNQRGFHHDYSKPGNLLSKPLNSGGGRNPYAMQSFKNHYTSPDSVQILSKVYNNSRMPFPYNNAEKVLVPSAYHSSNSQIGRRY